MRSYSMENRDERLLETTMGSHYTGEVNKSKILN